LSRAIERDADGSVVRLDSAKPAILLLQNCSINGHSEADP